jgi:hypothetical protein
VNEGGRKIKQKKIGFGDLRVGPPSRSFLPKEMCHALAQSGGGDRVTFYLLLEDVPNSMIYGDR